MKTIEIKDTNTTSAEAVIVLNRAELRALVYTVFPNAIYQLNTELAQEQEQSPYYAQQKDSLDNILRLKESFEESLNNINN